MNLKTLVEEGYSILNGRIVDFYIESTGTALVSKVIIEGDNWKCNFGIYDLLRSDFNGLLFIKGLMDVLEASKISDITGKIVRLAAKPDEQVKIIGNILYDVWLNCDDYESKDSDLENTEIQVNGNNEDKLIEEEE